eukprot:SAG31_NODE_48812_length_167_cov_38.705882_1_plen_20_part_01
MYLCRNVFVLQASIDLATRS